MRDDHALAGGSRIQVSTCAALDKLLSCLSGGQGNTIHTVWGAIAASAFAEVIILGIIHKPLISRLQL